MVSNRTTGARPGFGMIEMLVVIGLIVVLVSITVAVASKVKGKSAEQQTVITLQAAIAIADNYLVETQTKINHQQNLSMPWNQARDRNAPGSTGSAVITGSGSTPQHRNANLFIERFVWTTLRLPATESMVRNLQAQKALRDTDNDGFLELVDGWNRSLAYVAFVKPTGSHPQYNDSFTADDFLPPHPEPYLASAGEDDQWGDASDDSNPVGTVREDNLYSFEPQGRSTR